MNILQLCDRLPCMLYNNLSHTNRKGLKEIKPEQMKLGVKTFWFYPQIGRACKNIRKYMFSDMFHLFQLDCFVHITMPMGIWQLYALTIVLLYTLLLFRWHADANIQSFYGKTLQYGQRYGDIFMLYDMKNSHERFSAKNDSTFSKKLWYLSSTLFSWSEILFKYSTMNGLLANTL